jgi:hypothetical protein
MKVTMPLAVILGLVQDKPEDDKWEERRLENVGVKRTRLGRTLRV